ncbi:MAG: hypothetical protein A4E73_01925 [Syntrophaceae bacterium PtaU1.Bin231]|nr:MAG: hypothetical protein A4E73_01925 [Syntrophaceae bacterium PtaU1.Bin231]
MLCRTGSSCLGMYHTRISSPVLMSTGSVIFIVIISGTVSDGYRIRSLAGVTSTTRPFTVWSFSARHEDTAMFASFPEETVSSIPRNHRETDDPQISQPARRSIPSARPMIARRCARLVCMIRKHRVTRAIHRRDGAVRQARSARCRADRALRFSAPAVGFFGRVYRQAALRCIPRPPYI